MKHIISIICLQWFIFSVVSQVDNDSLCFRLSQFEKIKGNDLKYTSDTDHICSNFNIIELPTDSNRINRLFIFENVMYEESDPGFILIEKNKIEIYDLFTFSHLIKRIINSNVHPDTLKVWIVIILEHYDQLLSEMSTGNIIIKFNKGLCDFYVTSRSVKKK